MIRGFYMENWKQSLGRVFIYAGIEKQEYLDIREDIHERNRKMLLWGTELALAVFMVLFFMACSHKAVPNSRILYLAVILELMVLLGLQRIFVSRYPRLVLPCCYLLLAVLYGFSVLQSTLVQRQFPAVTFCVLLFAAAFLFFDRPYRMSLFLTAVTVIFCFSAQHQKPPEIAGIDTVHAVCFLLSGIVCNTYLTVIKAKNLVHSRNTQKELDTDGLTKLMVKKAAEREIRKYISTTREPGTLLMIDLDNFKQVNDTKGHAYGDVVLKLTGDCISRAFDAGDIKGRFGGDEFVVFLPGISNRQIITERLKHFKTLMEQGVTGDENRNGICQSIGVAMYPEDGEDYQTLFEKADQALYEAKRLGKNRYCFYTSVKIHKRNTL